MQEPYQFVTFEHHIEGDKDNTEIDVQRRIEGTRGEILTNLLAEFRDFLTAIGFTYVSEITAVTNNGFRAFSSNDD